METSVENKFDAKGIIAELNKISEAIENRGSLKKKYKFNKPDNTNGGKNNARKEMEMHYNKIRQLKYNVCVYENIDDKDMTKGNKFFIRITEPNGSFMDIDFLEYKKICLDYLTNEYIFIENCIEKLVGVIGENDREAVNEIVEYLSYLYYFKDEHIKLYNNIGWAEYDGLNIFKYDVIYSKRFAIDGGCMNKVKGECMNGIKDALHAENKNPDGKLIWAQCAGNIMDNSILASIVIAASISGIFRQMLPFTKETNINMNIVGERAIGKSTISHFALSFFGNPEILEGSFTDTDNAMEVIRAERTVIPYILDERMLKIEGASEAAKKKNLLLDIFREYEGKVKERMGKQYEGMSGKRTYSPIISSSVESMLGMIFDYTDLGQFRRFMEFAVDDKHILFHNGQEAEIVEEIAYTHYGYGVEILITFLFNHGLEEEEKINENFKRINDIMEEMIEKYEKIYNVKGIKASSKRFSLIVLSYTMLQMALDEFLKGHAGKGIAEREIEVMDTLIENAVEKIEKVKKRIPVRKNMLKFIKKYKNQFYQDKKAWDGTGEYLGELKETDGEYVISIKKGSFVWWLMASPMEYAEEDLKKYVKILIDREYKNMGRVAASLAGDLPEKDFKKFFSKYKDGVDIDEKKVPKSRFDVIIVSRKDFDATDKKDPEEEK